MPAWISSWTCDSGRFLFGDSPLFSSVCFYSAYLFVWKYISPVGDLLFFSFIEEINQSPKDKIAYVPLDPVSDYIYILDLNTRLRVG